MSCAVTRTLSPARRTDPSSTVDTESSEAISANRLVRPLYVITDVREMTLRSRIFDRWVMMSSITPSAKVSVDSSRGRLSNGRTAIDFPTVGRVTVGPGVDATRLGVRRGRSSVTSVAAASSAARTSPAC